MHLNKIIRWISASICNTCCFRMLCQEFTEGSVCLPNNTVSWIRPINICNKKIKSHKRSLAIFSG